MTVNEEFATEDTDCPDKAESLAERLSDKFSGQRFHRSTMNPAISAHTSPGLLTIAILGDKE